MTKAKKTPKPKAATPTPTLVTFLLDKSSSMFVCRDSTIEAFNGYVDGLRDTPLIDLTLVQFDQFSNQMQLDKTFVAIPVKDAPKLSLETYQPRGSTPLIDAAYTVIKAVETFLLDKQRDRNGGAHDTKVVICIQTDGQENCSSTYSWELLNTLIKEKQALGWQFNFMGAGIDAYQQGTKMGIAQGATMSYDSSSPRATRSAFRASSANTARFSGGFSKDTNYSDAQKQAAGDRFDPALVGKTLPGGASGGPVGVSPSPFWVNTFDLTKVEDNPPIAKPPQTEQFKL